MCRSISRSTSVKNCAIYQKPRHLPKTASSIKNRVIYQKMRHLSKTAPSPKNCVIYQKLRHLSKTAPSPKNCAISQKLRHLSKTASSTKNCVIPTGAAHSPIVSGAVEGPPHFVFVFVLSLLCSCFAVACSLFAHPQRSLPPSRTRSLTIKKPQSHHTPPAIHHVLNHQISPRPSTEYPKELPKFPKENP